MQNSVSLRTFAHECWHPSVDLTHTYYCGVCSKNDFLFPSFLLHFLIGIHSPVRKNCILLISLWPCQYFLLWILYNPMLSLFILLCKLIQPWLLGALLDWILCSFDVTTWVFDITLVFWQKRCPRIISYNFLLYT